VYKTQVEDVYSLFVKDLLLENYKVWDITKIRNLFIGLMIEEIIATLFISSVKEDKVVWERMKGIGAIRLNLTTISRHEMYYSK
jgi:hypothetical protein